MSPKRDRTSQTLLNRARDWADHQAWDEMFRRYDPMMVRWSKKYLSNEADVADLNQLVWMDLAERLIRFRYDPGKSFRAWLRTLHRCRLVDFIRAGQRSRAIEEEARGHLAETRLSHDDGLSFETTQESVSGPGEQIQASMLLIQAKVQNRVQEKTWQIFWSIAMDQRSIGETACDFEMTYTATFAAFTRVERMLREEVLKV